MHSIELFVGAGGLALGSALVGFEPQAVIEWNHHACETVRLNQQRGNPLVNDWNLIEGDVRSFDFKVYEEKIDLLAGGPPCQPFSFGGLAKADLDARDMFPAAINAVRQVKPKAFVFENVKGLTRPAFATYLSYILLSLEFPEIALRDGESRLDHLARLEREKTCGQYEGLRYDIVFRVLDAADYGVPQRRERVFIVGFRHEMGVRWSFPNPTHGQDALLRDQYVTGSYLSRHGISKSLLPELDKKTLLRLQSQSLIPNSVKPWVTIRDAIAGLPDPRSEESDRFLNHEFRGWTRSYPGHTGSVLDQPSKTIKAGAHGVPGGENMVVLPTGESRYLSVREAARIQTFPDTYAFTGSWGEAMRQIGNACPVKLARSVISGVAEQLVLSAESRMAATMGATI